MKPRNKYAAKTWKYYLEAWKNRKQYSAKKAKKTVLLLCVCARVRVLIRRLLTEQDVKEKKHEDGWKEVTQGSAGNNTLSYAVPTFQSEIFQLL